ncbi:MAG: FAD-binding oxidoreductase [Actinomycetes bacterium]
MQAPPTKSHWGWGWDDRFPDRPTRSGWAGHVQGLLGFAAPRLDDPVPIADVELAPARIAVPDSLAAIMSADPATRIRHTYGRAYPDVLRGFRGDFAAAPDLVATPTAEAEVVALLDWAADAGVAVVPYGGGTSVVGGVTIAADAAESGVVCLDMTSLDRLLEIEPLSLNARIQAGATGPVLERQLAKHGLTLRFFPKSFEHSTLGGWIATRAGGHFATGYTHIDDLVASTRMLTPCGPMESRRLPGSGAGPSPDRLVLGSEGALGVITEAWMRVRPSPIYRAGATVEFTNWNDAVEAVRALSQSGLQPSNCRLLDPQEAAINGVSSTGVSVLIVGFESADHDLHPWMVRALELTSDHHGQCPAGPTYRESAPPSTPSMDAAQSDGAQAWREAFIAAPYLLNIGASMGLIMDTFETAVPWDRFEALHTAITTNVQATLDSECGAGSLSCRFTHVYPDGPAPYYTFVAPGRYGHELDQWATIKQVASDTLLDFGATITHHHAVGRTHLPWAQRQRPTLFGEVLAAAKDTLDPDGIMNPGVLI